ncbi:MAG: phasin family protein [Sphingomonadales bacterium]
MAKAPVPVVAMKAPAKPAVAKKIAPIVARPVTPVAAAPAVAKPAATVAAPVAVVQPVPAKPIEVKPVETKPAAAPVLTAPVKEKTMNDTVTKVQETIKQTTEEATAKATAFFNDASGRTKDAVAKGTKAVEEMVEFSKGNLEALAASGRVAAKGAEEIAKYSAEYGRATIEKANATAKQFAAVKSPTEFFQLQGDVAKQTLDAVVAEGSKFTESYLKLLGEMFQPIQNRYAVAVEKVKSTVAA